jgi:hypothetical protein
MNCRDLLSLTSLNLGSANNNMLIFLDMYRNLMDLLNGYEGSLSKLAKKLEA